MKSKKLHTYQRIQYLSIICICFFLSEHVFAENTEESKYKVCGDLAVDDCEILKQMFVAMDNQKMVQGAQNDIADKNKEDYTFRDFANLIKIKASVGHTNSDLGEIDTNGALTEKIKNRTVRDISFGIFDVPIGDTLAKLSSREKGAKFDDPLLKHLKAKAYVKYGKGFQDTGLADALMLDETRDTESTYYIGVSYEITMKQLFGW